MRGTRRVFPALVCGGLFGLAAHATPVTFNLGTPQTQLDGGTLTSSDVLTVFAPANTDTGLLVNSGASVSVLTTDATNRSQSQAASFSLNNFTLTSPPAR